MIQLYDFNYDLVGENEMKLGVVGLPNVGKSTLFNAITKNGVPSENYPFCTIEPNVGVVAVPDFRLENLRELHNSKKVIPAIIDFVDIAGLVKGASKGEGLGNKFLSHIREVDAIVHVVRCFENDNITHVDGSVNPIRDIETINLELILSDLESVIKRLERIQKLAKSGDANARVEADLLQQLKTLLENEQPVRKFLATATKEIADIVKSFFLITSKPIIYCANIAEDQIGMPEEELPLVNKVKEYAENENSQVIVVSARFEEELSMLTDEEAEMFKEELGITTTGLDKLIQAGYELLGLISYITAGEKEIHAWTISKGTKAPQAAGKIHTDFERGFIRAEVISYEDLMEIGSTVKAKELGKVNVVGKEYVVKDGDVILFRFNV